MFISSIRFFILTLNATNDGEAEIASWYYPLIGPYDSSDPAVLEYHVLLMKLGGIDGVIVDWYGPDNYYDYLVNNQRTLDMFAYTRKAGLQFSLCYEDSTIQAEINGGCMNSVCVTAGNALAHAQGEHALCADQFLRVHQFSQMEQPSGISEFRSRNILITGADWTSIFSGLNASNEPAFFTENNDLWRRPAPALLTGPRCTKPAAIPGPGPEQRRKCYLAAF